MQSEPTEVTQKTSQDSFQTAQSSSQYGIHEPYVPARSSLRNEDGAAEQRPPLREGETPANALSEDGEDGTEQDFYELQRRVSSTSLKRTGSPVDRIIEHEEAVLTAAKRRNDGPAFTVVQSKGFQSQRLNLTHFPNGKILSVANFCFRIVLIEATQRFSRTSCPIFRHQRSLRSHLFQDDSVIWSHLHTHGELRFRVIFQRKRH